MSRVTALNNHDFDSREIVANVRSEIRGEAIGSRATIDRDHGNSNATKNIVTHDGKHGYIEQIEHRAKAVPTGHGSKYRVDQQSL